MRHAFAVGLLALSLPVLARAQEAVTEEQFVAGVDERHPVVRALQEGLALAEAARIRAGTLSNPSVEFWREQPEANPRVTNWTLAWTPPLDGRRGPARKAADAGVAAARETAALDRVRLRQELRRAFAAWSLGPERREHLAAQVDLVGRLAEAERQRARAGEASGLSARRLDLSRAEVQAALRDAEAELARAEAAARAFRPDLSAEVKPGSAQPPEAPAALSAEGSPELNALAHDVERWTLEARRAGRFWGFPTLQFGWQRLDDKGLVHDGPIFAANWSVPLFDRDKAARVEADRRTEVAQARLEQARSRIVAEVAGELAAYRALLTSSREARQAADESGPAIDAATASYRAGEATLTDLLDTLRTAFAARLRELDIRASALQAHRALEAALGQPLAGGGR